MHRLTWADWHVTWTSLIVPALIAAVGWYRRKVGRSAVWVALAAASAALVSSPLHRSAMHDYSSHMVEHVLVVLVLAPLAVLAWRPSGVTRSAMTFAFLTYVVLVPLYHLTQLGGIVMSSSGEHATELIIFGLVGIFFWCGPYASDMSALERTSYVALALPVSIFTGIALHSSKQTPFTGMDMTPTLHDVQRGGLVMAVLSSIFLLVHLGGTNITARRSQ